MLRLLHIENIAVIERADILFERGFNVMTGETGAGKSIVIDAISAILGERAYRDMIRTGTQKAAVRAIFELSLIHIYSLCPVSVRTERHGHLRGAGHEYFRRFASASSAEAGQAGELPPCGQASLLRIGG